MWKIFHLWTLDGFLIAWLPITETPQACSVKKTVQTSSAVDLLGWLWSAMCSILSLSVTGRDWWSRDFVTAITHLSPVVGRFEISVRSARVCACSPHGQCVCLRMWRCYAESVRCRTSSIWPRVEISLLRRGGLQRRWTSLHLAGGFKGHLTSRLSTTHPYHIATEKGLPQAHTTSPLVLGKRHLSWFCAWGVGWGQDDPTKVPWIMLWMIIWPELQTRVFKVDWGDILNLELTYFKYIHRDSDNRKVLISLWRMQQRIMCLHLLTASSSLAPAILG